MVLLWSMDSRGVGFSSCGVGSVVVAHGLSCSVACGIFPDQGSKPVSTALAGGFLTTVPPGKPTVFILACICHTDPM